MALATARRHQQLSAHLVQRAVKQASAGRDVATVVLEHQVAQAQLSMVAVPQMLAEQRVTTPADAPLNPQAFTTDATVVRSMADSAGHQGFAFDRLIASLVQDAGRAAEGVSVASRPRVGYVRHLNAPSCSRCAVLAGRVYRYNEGFLRHPHDDCTTTPVSEGDDRLALDPVEMARSGQITGLSKADTQALQDGADFNQVVNVRSRAAGLTESGQTLIRAGRPTPAAIYRSTNNRDEAVAALSAAGYLRS